MFSNNSNIRSLSVSQKQSPSGSRSGTPTRVVNDSRYYQQYIVPPQTQIVQPYLTQTIVNGSNNQSYRSNIESPNKYITLNPNKTIVNGINNNSYRSNWESPKYVIPYQVLPKQPTDSNNVSISKVSIRDSISDNNQDNNLITLQRQRINQLQERIDQLNAEYQRLAEKFNEIQNDNKKLTYENKNLKSEHENNSQESSNLAKMIIENDKKLTKITNEKNAEIQKQQELIQEKQKEIEIWQENYSHAEQQFVLQVNTTRENISELEDEIGKLHQLYNQEKQQRQQNELQMQILLQEKNQFKLVIEELEVQVRGLERSHSKNNSCNYQDVGFYENEIASLRTQLRESLDNKNYEKQKFEQYTQNMNKFYEELNYYKSKNQEYESIGPFVRDLQQKLQFLQQENNRLNEIMVGRCRDMMNNMWK